MRYKEGFVTTVNSLDILSNQLKATNYEQIAKSLEKSSAGLNKAIESIVSKIDYDTIYKSITASSLVASEAIRSISENYSKILNTIPKIITEYSNSIEAVYKSLNSFYNSKEFIILCETLINSNNYNYSEEDTKEAINSITYTDIENINKNDHSLPRQIIVWLMITFILEPLIAIPQEQITNWYKEQIPKIVEFINSKYKQLSEISIFSTEKINVSKLNMTSYISTENMLQNLSGITKSVSLPKVDKVTSFRKGDILLSNIRPYFKKMWYATFDGGCSNDVLVIRSKESVDSKYLYYFLSQPTFFQYVTKTSKGTKMPRGDKQAIMKYSIYVPSFIVQKKIVKILESIDKKIVLNKKTNDNLSKLCNNIFHNYLDKYGDKIEYKKIIDIAKKVVTGKTPSTAIKDFWDGSIPFITIPDMHNQIFTIKTERNITEVGAKSIIPKNSLSVSCIATVGLVSINTEESQTNQQINSIVLNNDYDLYFLYEYLSEQEKFMKSIAGGSTTYNINKNTFENIEVPYLPKEELMEFDNNVSNLFEKIKLNQYENERLVQLRDTLLPRLMNGEIDLDNIEI